MNWMGKLESLVLTLKEEAFAHWEVAALLALMSAVGCAIVAVKNVDKRDAMRSKMRIFRYCHNCQWVDMQTETCAIDAANNEKCALIDKTSQNSFTVTKND